MATSMTSGTSDDSGGPLPTPRAGSSQTWWQCVCVHVSIPPSRPPSINASFLPPSLAPSSPSSSSLPHTLPLSSSPHLESLPLSLPSPLPLPLSRKAGVSAQRPARAHRARPRHRTATAGPRTRNPAKSRGQGLSEPVAVTPTPDPEPQFPAAAAQHTRLVTPRRRREPRIGGPASNGQEAATSSDIAHPPLAAAPSQRCARRQTRCAPAGRRREGPRGWTPRARRAPAQPAAASSPCSIPHAVPPLSSYGNPPSSRPLLPSASFPPGSCPLPRRTPYSGEGVARDGGGTSINVAPGRAKMALNTCRRVGAGPCGCRAVGPGRPAQSGGSLEAEAGSRPSRRRERTGTVQRRAVTGQSRCSDAAGMLQ